MARRDGVMGAGARRVTFTLLQLKTWQDTLTYADSPWSPPYIMPAAPADGKWVVQAVFDEPIDLDTVSGDGSAPFAFSPYYAAVVANQPGDTGEPPS